MGQIDIEQSIKTKRLKRNDSLMTKIGRGLWRALFYLLALVIVYSALQDIRDGFVDDNLPVVRVIVDILFISLASWLVYGLINIDSLTILEGSSKSANKDIMHNLLSEMFADMKFIFIEDQLIGVRPWTLRIPGKEIYMIFKDSNIYINISRVIRFGDVISPFHVFLNQTEIREIKSKFKEHV